MDVLRHVLGQACDLDPDQLDGGRDGGEVGGHLRPLHPRREGAHGLFQCADIAATGEAADGFAQAARLVLKLGDGR